MKIIKVKRRKECPWFEEVENGSTPFYCNKEIGFIEPRFIYEYPRWCPLEDAEKREEK